MKNKLINLIKVNINIKSTDSIYSSNDGYFHWVDKIDYLWTYRVENKDQVLRSAFLKFLMTSDAQLYLERFERLAKDRYRVFHALHSVDFVLTILE